MGPGSKSMAWAAASGLFALWEIRARRAQAGAGGSGTVCSGNTCPPRVTGCEFVRHTSAGVEFG